MKKPLKVPQAVLVRARRAAEKKAVAPPRRKEPVREKLIAALKKLHPMD